MRAPCQAGRVVDEPVQRGWAPGRPVDLAATLGPLGRGAFDPTVRFVGRRFWLTALTPAGPGSLSLTVDDPARPSAVVTALAWGAGSGWLLDQVPDLLGAGDVGAAEFDPDHPLVREVWRRNQGWRVPCTGLVAQAVVPVVLEQKVTGREARASWRRLVLTFGSAAPGPVPDGMAVVPSPSGWVAIPSWEWHRAGVGPERSAAIVQAMRRADALERTLGLPGAEIDRRLCSLPGIGPWTSAEVRQRAHGDADAVSVGDYHLAAAVVHALTGERGGDDAAMLALLAPYAGHRYRVVRMTELAGGLGAPLERRGPRYSPLDHRSR